MGIFIKYFLEVINVYGKKTITGQLVLELNTHQRKNGSQHNKNAPTMMPSVRAALCSARHDLPAARRDAPVGKKEKYCNIKSF